ncbi:DUF927 domain-containing protein [Oceaniglobus roseus]|uniref:DUF927 domain-containing protein n=1 Tax=Oceaniglobus roseus TaxID=1737570 RepID=UPI000C7F00E8|nr:DUF927 domain-containing protein [Kandeliimicrobium roseum]
MDNESSNDNIHGRNASNVIPLTGSRNEVAPVIEESLPERRDANEEFPPEPREAPPAACLPEGYFSTADGIWFEKQTDDEEAAAPIWVCSPLSVVGLCRGIDGKGWSRVVDVVDPDEYRHRLLLDEAEVQSSPAALMRKLLTHGLQLSTAPGTKERVAHLVKAWRPLDRFLRVSRPGWVDGDFDIFVFANGEVIGPKRVILDRYTGIVGEMSKTTGSIDGWKAGVGSACVGNPLMLLAVSQAYVGPLLAPLGLEGGGFHLRGASSRGKSTLMKLAASVWGSPSFCQSWRTTDNAVEDVASCCSDALLALDELHQADPKAAADIVYMLSDGRGKLRMTSGGAAKTPGGWHVATLSTGEITLEEHLASGGKKFHAGQDVRLIDIDAESRAFGAFDKLHGSAEPGRFVERLVDAAAANYGRASRVFVERLIGALTDRAKMENVITLFVALVTKRNDLDQNGQVRRVLKRFALAALAGELATTFGLTGWKRGDAFDGILEVASVWIGERDLVTVGAVNAARERTRDHLLANAAGFVPCGPDPAPEGWRDETHYYVRSDVWAHIHGVEGAQQAARLLKAAHLLKTDKGDTLQFRMPRRVPGRPKAYAVSVEVFENRPSALST